MVTHLILFQYAILTTQCNELCKIARALNSTAISKYVTLKMTDVPSKHVWKITESCCVYTTIYIVAAIQAFWINSQFKNMLTSIDPSMLSSSSIVQVQVCPSPQIFSKQQMSPLELSYCCSYHIFSYFFSQFLLLKRVKYPPFFVFATKTTQPRPQVFSVNGALTCTNAAFLTSFPR